MDNLRVIYLSVFLTICLQTAIATDIPVASEGVIDLSSYSFTDDGPVDLSGEWYLYWNQFILKNFEEYKGDVYLVNVPGSWNQYSRQDLPVNRVGYATYRLIILLPPGIDRLGFRIHDVFTGSAYYINGSKFLNVGAPASNSFQTDIKVREPFVEAEIMDHRIELVVHVSNFEHRAGGIRGNISIGLPEQIKSLKNRRTSINYMLMGAFLIIGIYFMSLFLIRFEKYRLYFSLICLMMVFRIVVIGEIDIYNNLNITSIARFRLEYLSFYLIIPFFILMIRALFPFEFNRMVLRILLWISGAFVLVVLFTPLKVFSYTLSVYQGYFLAAAAVILYVLILAWRRGRTHAPAFTIGMTLLILGVINDLLYVTDNIETGNISQFTMFIYLLIYANIFAAKTLRLVNRTESLSKEIQGVNANLETLVEKRTLKLKESSARVDIQRQELEVSNKNLSKAIASRNRMFSIIGHDVRGPIGYIRQGLELMAENGKNLDKDDKELINLMATSAHKTFDLLENLMLWGRSQVGNLDPKPIHVNLKSVVEEGLEIMDLGIREKYLTIDVSIDNVLGVWIDHDQLQIVIRNLLSNAIKFTPTGGQISFSVAEEVSKDELIMEISDTGIGIPENMQPKLFDPDEIYTINGTNQEKGSGLGLKLCKEIIEANGGWINFTSKSGKGSVFRIGMQTKSKKI